MGEAKEVTASLLGLPELPVVGWPPDGQDDQPARMHWKTRGLVEWAAGRRFVWVDDEITDADRHWVAAHHHAPALLHRVDPRRGLTHDDIDTISAWLTTISQPEPTRDATTRPCPLNAAEQQHLAEA